MATTGTVAAPVHAIEPRSRQIAFASLRHGDFRIYLFTNVLFMIGDNIEHVVSYWALFQLFQNPILGGYAVISHWMPSLLFSVYAGSLADRYDSRRLIQAAMSMFLGCSLAWGIMLLTNSLQVWEAMLILTIHGFAVVIRGPAGQLIIHDMVGAEHLGSAIRLSATGIQLGLVLGPAIGGGLMLLVGPAVGLLLNSLLYLPLIIWLAFVPYTGHLTEPAHASRPVRIGPEDLARVVRQASANKSILAMLILAGATSLLIGSGIQSQMPEFARDFGETGGGARYAILQMASAVGAMLGGLALEGGDLFPPRVRTAIVCGLLFGVSVIAFAAVSSFAAALVLLFAIGVFRLAFSSMAQTIVQTLAPAQLRGRIMGVFFMSQQGLQTGSGLTIGVLGAYVGVHWSLGLSGLVVVAITICLLAMSRATTNRPNSPLPA